ncbi:uncharacterized protein LOC109500673 isoform X2 [Felis catus]|uniref:uncharacterized protein LOC109500673 isoform X2 n=1 Tax=Felis catus TaxID=9685 RepID=UPI001D19C804|nr:uncharacterized protein LOC109500673 isoform X2 [Felis catus]
MTIDSKTSNKSPPSEEPPYHLGWSHTQGDPEECSSKLLDVISLKLQEETKIKINGKPCQILVDTRAILPTFNLTRSGDSRWDPGETGRSQQRMRIHTRVSYSGSLYCPVERRRENYVLVSFVLCPNNLAWLYACLPHAGCQFECIQKLSRGLGVGSCKICLDRNAFFPELNETMYPGGKKNIPKTNSSKSRTQELPTK